MRACVLVCACERAQGSAWVWACVRVCMCARVRATSVPRPQPSSVSESDIDVVLNPRGLLCANLSWQLALFIRLHGAGAAIYRPVVNENSMAGRVRRRGLLLERGPIVAQRPQTAPYKRKPPSVLPCVFCAHASWRTGIHGRWLQVSMACVPPKTGWAAICTVPI